MWPEYIVPDEFADTPEELNLADYLLDRHVREGRGGNPAIRFMDETVTYAELQERVNRFGNALKEAGADPQDTIGIRLVNRPDALVAILAIEKIGAIPIPTSPMWSVEEIAYVVNDARMKFYVISAALMGVVRKAAADFTSGTRLIVIGGDPEQIEGEGHLSFHKMMSAASPRLDATMLQGNDIALILYTSGTTGMPKGCVHFLRPTVIETKMVNRYVYRLAPGDILGGVAPVSFAAGFGTFTLIPLDGGAAVSLLPKFNPREMMETVAKHRITVLTGLPTAYRTLLKYPYIRNYDFRSIRLYTSGGDSLGAETFAEWKELTGMPIWEGMGVTEMLHLVTSNTMNPRPVPNSIGKPLPGVLVRVIDAAGRECKPGETGTMILKGPSGSLYWRPHENGRRLLHSQARSVVDGWNHLGDAVYMAEDGNLFFVSREDDIIKSSGYRISPTEIEEAIARHPGVADVGVVGMPHPEKGQVTKAVIVLAPGQVPGDEFSDELREFLREKIARYKFPRIIEYADSLPRSPTGKLLRRKLRG